MLMPDLPSGEVGQGQGHEDPTHQNVTGSRPSEFPDYRYGCPVLSLWHITSALQHHIVNGSVDLDYINHFLSPIARLILLPYEPHTDGTLNLEYETSASHRSKAQGQTIGSDGYHQAQRPVHLLSTGIRAGALTNLETEEYSQDIPCRSNISYAQLRSSSTQEHPLERSRESVIGRSSQKRVRQREEEVEENRAQLERPLRKPRQDPASDPIEQEEHSQNIGLVRRIPSANLDAQFNNRKQAFLSKWAKKAPMLAQWQRLDQLALIGTSPNQRPYSELDVVVSNICAWGTSEIREKFVSNITRWTAKQEATIAETAPPSHLRTIEGFDSMLFQRLWRAVNKVKERRGSEELATLLRRKSLVDFLACYEEVIVEVRTALKNKQLKLVYGQKAGVKARKILYKVLYPDIENPDKMRRLFDYEQRCATPYLRLCKKYGHTGILAMIPDKQKEVDIHYPHRIVALLEVLDVIKPDFNGPELRCYSKVIDLVDAGRIPSQELLKQVTAGATKSSLE